MGERTGRPFGGQWAGFVLLGLVCGIAQLSYYLPSAGLPLYLRDLGAAQSRIGFDVGLGSVATFAVTFALGPAINRYGAHRFVRFGGLLYLIAAVGMLAFPHELVVTAFRTLQGAGAALVMPSAFTIGAHLLPERRGTVVGSLGVVASAALAIGPLAGLTLYNVYGAIGLLGPSVVTAALGFLLSFLVPIAPPSPDRTQGFGYDRAWTRLLIFNALSAIYFGGILAYLPLYLRHTHGPNAGIFFTADAVGVLLLRLPTGMLIDRRGSFLPKILGAALTLPGLALLALPPSIPALMLAGAATGMGAGAFVTGVYTDLANGSTAANRGTAMSLGTGTFSGAIFLGSSISGLLVGPGGFNAVLIFGAVSCVAALPFVLQRTIPARTGEYAA